MTDWDLITKYIHNAMQAVDRAHEAGTTLREHTSRETFDGFRNQIEELHEHLAALKNALEHSSAYSMDELVDALSKMYSGKPAAYRRTKHIDS